MLIGVFFAGTLMLPAQGTHRTGIESPAAADTLISATLEVNVSLPGAPVYIDDRFIGIAPVGQVSISAGRHILLVTSPDERSWSTTVHAETLVIGEGEHLVRAVRPPVVYHITSDPHGAAVSIGDSIVGKTPLIVELPGPVTMISLSLKDFENTVLPVRQGMTSVHAVLSPLHGIHVDRGQIPVEDGRQSNDLPLYLTAGASVVSGIAAAALKDRADNLYAEYRRTGEPDELNRVHRYDTFAGIALASCEINLFLLAYMLLSR